jgi:hypothetical protein
MLCNIVIDVTRWLPDEHHGIFPIGARDKQMLWSPEQTTALDIRANWPYLFKESIPRYPDQYWTEIVAYIVAKHLNVDAPSAIPAVKTTEDGVTTCGSLIEWFYDEKNTNKESLVHAGNYFKKLIPDFDEKTGRQHNLLDMNKIIRQFSISGKLLTNRCDWLIDMMLFDAIIGNTDRHQENWGIVFQANGNIRLSPLFDNGTSLGHERFPNKVQDWSDQTIRKYIQKGQHHVRFSSDSKSLRISHFPLMGFLSVLRIFSLDYVKHKLHTFDVSALFEEIESLTNVKIAVAFSLERCEWIKKVISMRIAFIKEELKNADN